MEVVDDLLAHVDGRPVELERPLDRLDRPLDPGAVAAGRGEKHLANHPGQCRDRRLRPRKEPGERRRLAARGVDEASLLVLYRGATTSRHSRGPHCPVPREPNAAGRRPPWADRPIFAITHVPFAPVSTATQSLLFNALPLLLLAGAYVVVAAALVPAVWRDRQRAHSLDVATVTIFPTLAFTAAVLAALVVVDRRPLGGHLWVAFAAIVVALVPANLLLARWSERGMLTNRARRVREAEELVSIRDRELGARRRDLRRARPRARRGVGRAPGRPPRERAARRRLHRGRPRRRGADRGDGHPRRAERRGRRLVARACASTSSTSRPRSRAPCSRARRSRSTTSRARAASASGSPSASARRAGSGCRWSPRDASSASSSPRRPASGASFTTDEISLLEALTAETALALDRLRSAGALATRSGASRRIAADRAQRAGRARAATRSSASRRRSSAPSSGSSARPSSSAPRSGRARRSRSPASASARCGSSGRCRSTRASGSSSRRSRARSASRSNTARLLAENERRLAQQGALLHAAQVVASELELDAVLAPARRGGDEAARRRRGRLLPARRGARRAPLRRRVRARGGARRLRVPVRPGRRRDGARARPPDLRGEVRRAAGADPARGVRRVHAGARRADGVGRRDARRPRRRRPQRDRPPPRRGGHEPARGVRGPRLARAAERRGARRARPADRRAARLLPDRVRALGAALARRDLRRGGAGRGRRARRRLRGGAACPTRGRLRRVGAYELPPEVEALELPAALADTAADARMLSSSRVADDGRLDPAWRDGAVRVAARDPGRGHRPGPRARLLPRGADVLVRRPRARAPARARGPRRVRAEPAVRGRARRARRLAAARAHGPAARGRARPGDARGRARRARGRARRVRRRGGRVRSRATGSRSRAAGRRGHRGRGRLVVALDRLARRRRASSSASRSPATTSPATRSSRGADPVLALRLPRVPRRPARRRARASRAACSPCTPPRRGRGARRRSRRSRRSPRTRRSRSRTPSCTSASRSSTRRAPRSSRTSPTGSSPSTATAASSLWNAAAETITGVPSAEALGRTPAQVLQRDFQSESGGSNRLVSIPRGAEEVWLSLSEAVMRDPAGAVAGRIFAFRDISSERAVEQMRSDFVSTVSHELRTPLTSIYGFAETLLRSDVAFGEAEREIVPRLHRVRVGAADADRRRAARTSRGSRAATSGSTSSRPTSARSSPTRSRRPARDRQRPPASSSTSRTASLEVQADPDEAAPGRRPARRERGPVLARAAASSGSRRGAGRTRSR